jgi:hypothetical protein
VQGWWSRWCRRHRAWRAFACTGAATRLRATRRKLGLTPACVRVRWYVCVRMCVWTLQVDRLYGWKSEADSPIRDSFKRQPDFVHTEFEQRSNQVRRGAVCGASV